MDKFEAYIKRHCDKQTYNLIIDVIGTYPDLYRPDLLRIKKPAGLDKKAKKSWELVVQNVKTEYPKLADDVIWTIWRWVRATYHNIQCPPFIAGTIPYLDAIKDEITNRPLARVYQSLIDGTKQTKPKRIRSRVAYLNQAVMKPFEWNAMEFFINSHGVDPCVMMVKVVSMHPLFYRDTLVNELMPKRLLGVLATAWNKIFAVLKRSYPYIREMAFYHAWRTLRRNFEHEKCPQEWADRLSFVRNDIEYDMRNQRGFKPLEIRTIEEAQNAISEMDKLDALMSKKNRPQDSKIVNTTTKSSPRLISCLRSEQLTLLPSVQSKNNEMNYGVERYQYTDNAIKYEDDPPLYQLKRKHVANFQLPEAVANQNLKKLKQSTTVPIVASTLNEQKRRKESDNHVRTEAQGLLEQIEARKTNDSFKAMLREKWMEFAVMEDSKTYISRFKKAIVTVVNDAYAEM